MKVSAARRAASEILLRVETEDAYASNLLAASRYDNLSREDRALAQELTLGTLRWQGQLDFLIERFSQRKVHRIDPAVLIALRLGLYQLRFLSRVPAHAALNESVNLVKAARFQSAAPMVNAVLRNAQRAAMNGMDALIEAVRDPLVRLSVETSHPAWLLRRWQQRLGETAARQLALSNNNAPRTAFRFNPRRASMEQTAQWLHEHGLEYTASPLTPGAQLIVSGHLSANAAPVREGWLYLQDEASQLIAHLAAVGKESPEFGIERSEWGKRSAVSGQQADEMREPGAADHQRSAINTQQATDAPQPTTSCRFLDVCAAPGSKATLLATLLPETSLIVACDLHGHRLQTMKRLMKLSGNDSIRLLQCDAAQDLPFVADGFDAVLLDAPCSGTGTLQRHPEIKWRLNEEKVRELASLQKRLLANAAKQVRIGGLLIYSVCATEPEEGEMVIEQFREQHPEYRDVTRERLTEIGHSPESLLTPAFGARTFTHRHGSESFFFCIMWKRR